MDEFQATGIFILLFALRCVAPLVLTIAVGYAMNRLVDRWEAEEAQTAPAQVVAPIIIPAKPEMPMRETAVTMLQQLPCWLVRGCDSTKRHACPAYQQQEKPCWMARLQLDGQLPADCPDCPVYQHAHA